MPTTKKSKTTLPGVEDSIHTKRPARGAANRVTAPPAAADAAAVAAAAIPHASALPPRCLILLRPLRLLQKIAPPLPLGAQLGERRIEQPHHPLLLMLLLSCCGETSCTCCSSPII